MERTRAADRRRLLSFVAEAEAAALADRAQIRELILGGLGQLLPGDRTVCVDWSVHEPGITTTSTDPTLEAGRARHVRLWLDCLPQHPTVCHWSQTNAGAAVRFSDLISRRAYHRLPLYHYFLRPFGVEYDVGARVELGPGRGIDVASTRSDHDFSEDERALLETLRPYLAAIVRRAEAGVFARTLSSTFGLTRRQGEIVALAARGARNAEIAAVLFLAPTTVRTHLENIYPKLAVTTRAELTALVRRSAGPSAVAGTLRGVVPAPAATYGLTRREVDVLTLVTEGRRDREIGGLLGIASTTVKKHLEHIYDKLDVRNRMEAAAHAVAAGLVAPSTEPTAP